MTDTTNEYEKLYDMNNVELTEKGKKIYSNIKNFFDKEIEGLIKDHNIDPLELSFLISSYANEQCMMIARENKMNKDMDERIENAEEKIMSDIPTT